jgi:hypothetical protein
MWTGVEGRFGNVTATVVASNSPDSTANVARDIDKFFSFILLSSFDLRYLFHEASFIDIRDIPIDESSKGTLSP